MPYYPNYQPQVATQEELLMFQQFKIQQMHQQQPQQSHKQLHSQPHSEQQSHHLEVEDTEDEEEPLPTPTSKPSRGGRLKSNFRGSKTGCDQKRDTFWYKIQNVYNKEAKKKGFTERTKNMLTGKWTPMNASVLKFNQLVQEIAVHSGENDDDHMSRVHTLYDATVGGKHKWINPDSTLQRRNRLLGTDEEPEHFGDDELPRPPGLQRHAKSQRTGSNSTASSGSNPAAYQEFMAEQYELDRKAVDPISKDCGRHACATNRHTRDGSGRRRYHQRLKGKNPSGISTTSKLVGAAKFMIFNFMHFNFM
ncbi:hypothetical protein Tco_0626268 [Tanacetum coccineum]|uniref:Uncharacterized protein n=1 Tax=Tanacetum coccineum TaxID=301880 RepID=A0ABQ4WJX0_9ASTR